MTQTLDPAHSFFYAPKTLKVVTPPDIKAGIERVSAYGQVPLNTEQAKAIVKSADNRLSLLWGPPGTGKTWTLAMLIMAWIEAAQTAGRAVSIMVGAANYNAIDNVLLAVSELVARRSPGAGAIHVARVRSDSSEPLGEPGIEDLTRKEAVQPAQDWSQPSECHVVGGTYLQLVKLSKDLSDTKQIGCALFDLIVLDEASQVSTLSAMAYATLAKAAAHMVVCGDDRQLGPVRHFTIEDTRQGLLESAFQFFKSAHGIDPVALKSNYRSNEVITGWPADRFYESFEAVAKERRLEFHSNDGRTPPGWPSDVPWTKAYDVLLDPAYPVCVVTYPDRSATVSNAFEAAVAAGLMRNYYLRSKLANPKLTAEAFWHKAAGLVTPHRAQIATIRNLLGADLMPADGGLSFIDTVDRFQGQERDLIIASYTVSDPDFIAGEEQFILDPRRFNVTMTRARSKFILLVSQTLMSHLPSDLRVAENAAHLQLLTHSYCTEPIVDLVLPMNTGTRACKLYRRTFEPVA